MPSHLHPHIAPFLTDTNSRASLAGVVSADSTPFGGVKASGHGREGGREGLAEYLEVKALCWGVLPEAKS